MMMMMMMIMMIMMMMMMIMMLMMLMCSSVFFLGIILVVSQTAKILSERPTWQRAKHFAKD